MTCPLIMDPSYQPKPAYDALWNELAEPDPWDVNHDCSIDVTERKGRGGTGGSGATRPVTVFKQETAQEGG